MSDYNANIKDLQNEIDKRNIPIKEVGVNNILIPIKFTDDDKDIHTNAKFTLATNLTKNLRGTHMSRFLEILNSQNSEFSLKSINSLSTQILKTFPFAKNSILKCTFPLFYQKNAPISKIKSTSSANIQITTKAGKKNSLTLKITVFATTLCPCSKDISKYGAHNQRGKISLKIKFINKIDFTKISIRKIIKIIEKSASSEIYNILKRVDEKYITEKAYENPAFVEDIVRNLQTILQKNKNISSKIKKFTIKSINFESIHTHNAYAKITENN